MRHLILLLLHVISVNAAARPTADNVIFSINVQDFARPDLSVATLKRLIAIHERHRVPVDFYLTTTMADLYEAKAPELIEQIKKSSLVSVSYHVRPPSPYYTKFDWLGLRDMGADQQRETIRRDRKSVV